MSAPPSDDRVSVIRVWPRAWRIMVANERLIANPIARRAAEWIAWILPVAVAGVGGFDGWARSAAQQDADLVDILEGTDGGVIAAACGAVVLATLASAWLLAAFCASVRDGRPTLRAGLGTIARIAALDIVAIALVLAAVLASPALGALVVLAVSLLLLYAPYLIALEGVGLRDGVVAGVRLLVRAPGPALLTVAVAILLIQLGDALLHRPVVEAATVFAPLALAAILFDGLVTYAIDCVVIATVVESDGAPASPPARAAA